MSHQYAKFFAGCECSDLLCHVSSKALAQIDPADEATASGDAPIGMGMQDDIETQPFSNSADDGGNSTATNRELDIFE